MTPSRARIGRETLPAQEFLHSYARAFFSCAGLRRGSLSAMSPARCTVIAPPSREHKQFRDIRLVVS